MARYPGAIWKPITANKGRKQMAAYNRVNLHVAVSEADSLHGYFNKPGIADSHLYVRKGTKHQLANKLPATVEQYVDTAMRANADLEGNDATISVETQGGVSNAQGEPWDASQVLALAQIFAWCVQTHGIEAKLATDSKLGRTSRGLSWHRLGVDGNFPEKPSILAGRAQLGGGMRYSTSRGKICPGDAKIRQIPGILELAVRGAVDGGGQSVPKPAPKPTPKPTPKPKPAPKPSKITVDGFWGKGTTKELQRVLGTVPDGEIWGQWSGWQSKNPGLTSGWVWTNNINATGSPVILALQKRLGVRADGKIGPATIKALQRRYGLVQDGEIWSGSPVVKELQKRLNEGKI